MRAIMAKKQEKVLYQTAANGMTVRIPAASYAKWKAGQKQPDSQDKQRLAQGLRQLLKR